MTLTFFCTYCNFCTAMMTFDHDKFLPPFVKLSTSPCCTYFSIQYKGFHYNNNSQHGTRYNSTKHTTLCLPDESQRTHLSIINVHNDRPIISAHFAQPMSHDSTYSLRPIKKTPRLCIENTIWSVFWVFFCRFWKYFYILASLACTQPTLLNGNSAYVALQPAASQTNMENMTWLKNSLN